LWFESLKVFFLFPHLFFSFPPPTHIFSFLFFLKMRVIAAYLLALLGGKASPSLGDIEKILSSVGIELDDEAKERATALIEELDGKDIEEVIREGEAKLSSAPVCVGSRGAPAAGGAAPAAGGAAPAAVEAAPEPVVEEKPESDEDMGMGLFGDEEDDY
jgi:large subunit ribosomal protein LP2